MITETYKIFPHDFSEALNPNIFKIQ